MKAARTAVLVAVVCALLAVFTVVTPSAQAQTTFNDDRAEFGGVNGRTFTAHAIGDQVWVGGTFTEAVDPDHITTHPRTNVAVFDFNTGDVLPWTFDTDAKVKAIESDGATTVWVAGNFTEIQGQPATYLAAFDALTGERNDAFSVTLNPEVNALHYNDGWLYIGGEFSQVNGLSYRSLVRVDAITGELDVNFGPNPDASVISIDTYGDRVYAAGMFEEIGTAPDNYARRWVAGLDVDTGQPAGADFALPPLNPNEASHRAGLWEVQVSPDGTAIYTADSRNLVIKWDRATGQRIWERGSKGDVQAVEAYGSTVFAGTHDGFLVQNDDRLLFALNAVDGTNDDSFQPLQNSFMGTLDITVSQGALIAVGDFTTIKGVSSPHIAVFHGPEWFGAEPLSPPHLLGDVSCDSMTDLGDALMIAQFSVGLRTQAASCDGLDPVNEIGPGGDVNDDGFIDIGDALLIAQCTVGLSNSFCPL